MFGSIFLQIVVQKEPGAIGILVMSILQFVARSHLRARAAGAGEGQFNKSARLDRFVGKATCDVSDSM